MIELEARLEGLEQIQLGEVPLLVDELLANAAKYDLAAIDWMLEQLGVLAAQGLVKMRTDKVLSDALHSRRRALRARK